MKRKDQIAEIRNKKRDGLISEMKTARQQLLANVDEKNIHAKRQERRRIARMATVARELEIISNE